jgi:hypothetical protein
MVRRRTLIQTRKDRRGIPYVASVAPPAKACLGYPRPACMVSQGVKACARCDHIKKQNRTKQNKPP